MSTSLSAKEALLCAEGYKEYPLRPSFLAIQAFAGWITSRRWELRPVAILPVRLTASRPHLSAGVARNDVVRLSTSSANELGRHTSRKLLVCVALHWSLDLEDRVRP